MESWHHKISWTLKKKIDGKIYFLLDKKCAPQGSIEYFDTSSKSLKDLIKSSAQQKLNYTAVHCKRKSYFCKIFNTSVEAS